MRTYILISVLNFALSLAVQTLLGTWYWDVSAPTFIHFATVQVGLGLALYGLAYSQLWKTLAVAIPISIAAQVWWTQVFFDATTWQLTKYFLAMTGVGITQSIIAGALTYKWALRHFTMKGVAQ